MGAMAAFELVSDKANHTPDAELTGALCKKAREKGLILLSCGSRLNVVRILTPLTIEEDILAEGLDILEASIEAAISASAV